MTAHSIALPKVVSTEEWHQARQALLAREKKLTRALDALAAERRLTMARRSMASGLVRSFDEQGRNTSVFG